MLESVAGGPGRAPGGSPTKHPAAAAGDDPRRRGAADPVHERDPRRHRRDRARIGSRRSRRSPRCTREYGHLQEVILQNFVPAPPLLRRGAGRDRRRAARATSYWRDRARPPPVARRCPTGLRGHDRRHARARRGRPRAAARRRHPGAAEPLGLVAGAGRGRRDRPRRACRANGDHISPEHPFPSPHQVRRRLAADGVALTERLCVYPQLHRPRVGRPGRARRDHGALLVASSRGAGRAAATTA